MKNIIYFISVIICPITTFVLGMYLSDLDADPNIRLARFILGVALAVLGLAGCFNVVETLIRTIRKFRKEH